MFTATSRAEVSMVKWSFNISKKAQQAEAKKLDIAPYISMCSATYPPKSGGCVCRDGGQVLMLDTEQCYMFADNPKLWSVRERQNQPFADAASANG